MTRETSGRFPLSGKSIVDFTTIRLPLLASFLTCAPPSFFRARSNSCLSGAGCVAKATGWPLFFAICVLVAVPSPIRLAWLQRRGHFEGLGTVRV